MSHATEQASPERLERQSYPSDGDGVFADGGEMGALMRSTDWSKTALGLVSTWPQSLRTTVSTCLNSRFPILIWWGPEMVMLYNDAYRSILGNKHPKSVGQRGCECWPEIWHIIGPMLQSVLDEGSATWSENQLLLLERHGFAEECYFTFSYSPIRDESGGIGGVYCAVTETTGQVLGERRLSALREMAERTAKSKTAEDACFIAAEVLSANVADVPFALFYLLEQGGQKARLVGSSRLSGDAASSVLADLNSPEPDGEWPLGEVARTGRSVRVDGLAPRLRALSAQAGLSPTDAALVLPVGLPGSTRLSGLLVVGLSSRLVLDEKYLSFLELLAGHVATAVASTRALQEARERADALAELDRAKTDFFSNVSHEFRTPLTLMLGPIEDGLADQDQPLPPAQRERQELVRRNGLRLQKLVNTLLDFARIEAGRAQAAFVPTDLAALTVDLASSFDSAMTSGGVKLIVDCPPLPEAVYVDPAMWEKVILNLLSNALKFTFTGEIRLALKWLGDRVELSVQDTGTGIPVEELPRVFERFHRVEGARGRSHEGTGIGLALVEELVKLHGGGVAVKSALGKGSTFTVSLPTGSAHLPQQLLGTGARTLTSTGIGPGAFLAEVSQWDATSAPPRSTPAPVNAAPSALQAGARILLADDNADMRSYLSRLLSPHWTVEAVGDGAQALAAALANPPDLVLSDVMMPGLSGLELAQALRADERTRTIPVVLLSARAGEEATIEGLESGADDYLIKPFSANELRARVNAQLRISSLRQEAVRQERAHAQEAGRLLEESRKATRAREEMLAVVSHDLRSPLTAIRMATDTLQRAAPEGDAGARVRKRAETIRSAAGRMDRLIADLLDLASIDAGTLSLQPTPHTAEELVRELREMFEPRAVEKGLVLTTDVEPGLPPIEVDKERIVQVFSNLLSNALKFTASGGGVRVRARREAEGVCFSVTDTGVGIPPAALAHVFDRYWHSTQKDREGHGLGLSIAQGIVESHGGSLRAESEVGRGSTFSCVLPFEMGAKAVGAAPLAPRPALARPTSEENFLKGGGEMGALVRSFDWAKTSLGPIVSWPQSLRSAVSTMLASPYPILLFWGPELVFLYNDAFRPIFGEKHPATLGAPAAWGVSEAWPQLGPMIQGVLTSGKALYVEDGSVPLERQPGGGMEETYFTWSYIPTRDESGKIGSIFTIVAETTRQVLAERRMRCLRELSIRTALDKKVEEVFRSVGEVLSQFSADLPFSLIYEVEGEVARLTSCNGLPLGGPASAAELPLKGETPWPLAGVARSGEELYLEDLDTRFGALPGGPWPEPARRALLLPVSAAVDAAARSVLIVGLSPRLPLDETYRGFLQQLARQIGASLASARAYEAERRRAEALAEIDRAKTAFFSNVSHEFRTPLTLILGPVEDALAQAHKTLSGEKLDLVRRNALRLYKMVNTLLDFSRMEAGRAQATYVPTDLSAFTVNLASAFQSAVESAGLKLVVNCPPLPETIYVDPEMWEKVVLNLLSNAVKYTYQGEIRISLAWEEQHALLVVQDTGIGIPADELSRVFERFYRVRVTQGRSHEGSGIGLALVQELVKLHGGEVNVSSRLGEGTTFTVRMPRGSAHLPSERVERTSRPRSSAMGAAPFVEEAQRWSVGAEDADKVLTEEADDATWEIAPALASSRILLVDDNADLRSYVAGLLGRVFPHVETATNGDKALERVRAQPPDLILSDVMMPVLDGFGLVRALRADARTRAIPIILLSARAGDESTVEGLQNGADDYLVKPFSARELLARVRTQLEMARIRREAARHEFAEERLRATVKARDEWLTVVSHELRTPLSALSLSVRALIRNVASETRAEAPPEIARKKAQAVERHLHRLTQQVDQLVGIAALVEGHLELTYEEVDVAAVVIAAVEQARAKAARLRCALSVSTGAPAVGRYDRARLQQLIDSVLDNALKFGAGQPVEIVVATEADHATIRIVDHGNGVAPEDRERIFGRFERAVPTLNHGGFGLGLWVARLIAEVHGGSLHHTPTEGGGATFTVRLPRAAPPDSALGGASASR